MKKFAILLTWIMAQIFTVYAQSTGDTARQIRYQPPQPVPLNDSSAPRFLFKDGETHDFGNVPEGPELRYIFRFKNIGKKPLEVQHANTSGGGAVAQCEHYPVLPGKTGEIIAMYSTQGRPGPFTKTIYITSNAACGKHTYELQIKGYVVEEKGRLTSSVVPSTSVTPAGEEPRPSPDDKKAPRFKFTEGNIHNFGHVKRGPVLTHVFRFQNIGSRPLHIYSVRSDGGALSEWSQDPILPGKYGAIKVSFLTEGRGPKTHFERLLPIRSNAATENGDINLVIKGDILPEEQSKTN